MKNSFWMKATTNPYEAIAGLMKCFSYNKNAWIEICENKEHPRPITIPSPELDNPFNWKATAGVYGALEDEWTTNHFINETEKDLCLNWVYGYGTEEAVKRYQETGEITEGLISCNGIGTPIRRKDEQEYCDRFKKSIITEPKRNIGWQTYSGWYYDWKPKDEINAYIPDPSIKYVFAIRFNNEKFDLKNSLLSASQFLKECTENGTIL